MLLRTDVKASAIATAEYRDTYAGWIDVQLLPYRTTRRGQPITLYRWMDSRGCTHGWLGGHSASWAMCAARFCTRFRYVYPVTE